MKLSSALSMYGLLPSDDLMRLDDVEAFTSASELLARVYYAGAKFYGQYVADPTFLTFRLTGAPCRQSGGVRWALPGIHRNYTWEHTDALRSEHSWKCGLIEAMFRRFAIGALIGSEIPTLIPVPQTYAEWV